MERLETRDDLAVLINERGEIVIDDDEKAELLKKFFQETYALSGRSGPNTTIPNSNSNLNFLNHVDFTELDVYNALSKIEPKWSTTPEGLPSGFHKNIKFGICKPLSMVFQRSLESAEVPKLFKESIVSPVHKRGKKTLVENKRPVSLTVILCKLMEKILVDLIMDNAKKQGLISPAQYGYRKKISTTPTAGNLQ